VIIRELVSSRRIAEAALRQEKASDPAFDIVTAVQSRPGPPSGLVAQTRLIEL
jgi:hypothetical protein